MLIKTQDELFSAPVKIKHITEKGINVSKLFIGEKIKVLFNGTVKRNGETVEIQGNLFVEGRLECSKCLREFIYNTTDQVKVFLKSSKSLPTKEEIELSFEDLDDDFYEGDEMDFYDYILKLGELCLPEFANCSEYCKGICPKCGENLNENNCSCNNSTQIKTNLDNLIKNLLPTKKSKNKTIK